MNWNAHIALDVLLLYLDFEGDVQELFYRGITLMHLLDC